MMKAFSLSIFIFLFSFVELDAQEIQLDPAKGSMSPFKQQMTTTRSLERPAMITSTLEELKLLNPSGERLGRWLSNIANSKCKNYAKLIESIESSDQDHDGIPKNLQTTYICDLSEQASSLPSVKMKESQTSVAMIDEDDGDWKSGFRIELSQKIFFEDGNSVENSWKERFHLVSIDTKPEGDKIFAEGFNEVVHELRYFEIEREQMTSSVSSTGATNRQRKVFKGKFRAHINQYFLQEDRPDAPSSRLGGEEVRGGKFSNVEISSLEEGSANATLRMSTGELLISSLGGLSHDLNKSVSNVYELAGELVIKDAEKNQLRIKYSAGPKAELQYNSEQAKVVSLFSNINR